MSKKQEVEKPVERRVEYMALDAIKGAETNPKEHARSALRKSFERFGFVEPMVLDERTGRLVAGHGRWEVMIEMRRKGAAPPDGVMVDAEGVWRVPVLRGWASTHDNEARAYLVASNKLTEAGGWDEDALGSLLSEVGSFDGLGFSEEELRQLTEEAWLPSELPSGDIDGTSEEVVELRGVVRLIGRDEDVTAKRRRVDALAAELATIVEWSRKK
jgi:ParB-like chromosome segregation protein Spo0J